MIRTASAQRHNPVIRLNTAAGIHMITDSYVNWYLIEEGQSLTIVDAGMPTSWQLLHDAVGMLGRTVRDLKALVLTHAHFDHVGFAERARRELGLPVLCHKDEVSLTRHPLRYKHERSRLMYMFRPASMPIIASFVRHGMFNVEPIRSVRTYRDGQVLDVPGSPRVVFTPGHTVGHCSLHLPDRDTVIAGDAIVTLDPYTGRTGPHIVARAATANSQMALDSLDRLARTSAKVVLSGHGEPWTSGVGSAVEQARRAGPP